VNLAKFRESFVRCLPYKLKSEDKFNQFLLQFFLNSFEIVLKNNILKIKNDPFYQFLSHTLKTKSNNVN